MPELNGQYSDSPRLDRIEKAIEFLVNEHARTDSKLTQADDRLARVEETLVSVGVKLDATAANVASLSNSVASLSNAMVKLELTVDRLVSHSDETTGKLNALIHVVDTDHREYRERLSRLESTQ